MSELRFFMQMALIFGCGGALIGLSEINLSSNRADFVNLAPPERIEFMTFGYYENVADSLWIRVIQDIDYCDAIAARGESGSARAPRELCHSDLGWTYKMLDAITTITPKFRMPYNHGATVLSVSVGDKEGARRIYERGIENFPADWSLQFRAAYHYMSEIGDNKRAAELLQLAGTNGAPPWVFALSARLYSAEGQTAVAQAMLENVIAEDPDSKFVDSLKERLKQLKELIAKGKRKADASRKPEK